MNNTVAIRDNISYETKSIKASIIDCDPELRVVTGYFSTTGVEDDQADTIQMGAYSRTLHDNGPESKNPRIVHLWMHDPMQVIGKPSVLKEDDHGLYFETKFPDTTLANDTLKLYQAEVLREHSIGFKTIQAEWLTNKDGSAKLNSAGIPRRVIKEIRLFEGSTVVWGANSAAQFEGFKGLFTPTGDKELDLKVIADKISRIDELLHSSEAPSDDSCIELSLLIEQLKNYTSVLTSEEDSATATPNAEDDSQPDVLLKGLLTLRDILTKR